MSELSSFRKASRIHKPFVDNAVLRWGSNHSWYIGFRGVNDKLMDGSINLIVADCKANNS